MIRLEPGDCRDVLATLDADSLDACVTDPFMLLSGNDTPEREMHAASAAAAIQLWEPRRAEIMSLYVDQKWSQQRVVDHFGVALRVIQRAMASARHTTPIRSLRWRGETAGIVTAGRQRYTGK